MQGGHGHQAQRNRFPVHAMPCRQVFGIANPGQFAKLWCRQSPVGCWAIGLLGLLAGDIVSSLATSCSCYHVFECLLSASSAGFRECSPCPIGTHTNKTGQTVCAACGESVLPLSGRECAASSAPGKFQDRDGQEQCKVRLYCWLCYSYLYCTALPCWPLPVRLRAAGVRVMRQWYAGLIADRGLNWNRHSP